MKITLFRCFFLHRYQPIYLDYRSDLMIPYLHLMHEKPVFVDFTYLIVKITAAFFVR